MDNDDSGNMREDEIKATDNCIAIGDTDGCTHESLTRVGSDNGKNTYFTCLECEAMIVEPTDSPGDSSMHPDTTTETNSNAILDLVRTLSDNHRGETHRSPTADIGTTLQTARDRLGKIVRRD
ncbi:hypothetical protein ACFO5R_00135 [Halosolutus amylolyticus]|uniref:Uncharacterized protein n=1 Tax=Halosolutus amylolyticus TaxID=2932267 RepID=A0ABD5PIY6_9EURY|nr:hypothetical protein [Halosolutus amylolyticus]